MRLIDADKLEKDLMDMAHNELMPDYFRQMCMSMAERVSKESTIEAEPVRHGRWIEKQTTIQCSNCGKEYNDEIRCMCYGEDAELNHCPKCGAKMDGKEVTGS